MEAQSSACHGNEIGVRLIEVTDTTIRQAKGSREIVNKLMTEDIGNNDWMLRSSAFITTPLAAANYILHFWKNGDAVIHETDRPMRMESSDDDLRELSLWARHHGWTLRVDSRLLQERIALEYWNRAFVAGLILSDILKKQEEEEMARLVKSEQIERNEDVSYAP